MCDVELLPGVSSNVYACKYKHAHTVHTHPRPIVYHVCTRNTHGTTPYSPSSITFTFSPASSSCPSFLSILCFFLSFFRSLSPAFPSVSRGRTCCRSDMQQHASVTADSVPVHPFIRSRSFFVHPSVHHPSTLLVISIDLAGAKTMIVCGTPPAIIRQASIHQHHPLCACVCRMTDYTSVFVLPGQLCLSL